MKNITEILHKRAEMLAKTRHFFSEKNIFEVDCPAALSCPNLDDHIDVIKLHVKPNRYLHSSPEYAMKRLLAAGAPAIYQLSHVYRNGEIGPLHNPEFTLVEWYRKNVSFSYFLEEILNFIRLFVGEVSCQKMSYKKAFEKFANIDYTKASIQDLKNLLVKHNIDFASEDILDKDEYLQLIFSHIIEPSFPKEGIIVIYDYPPTQAALSKIVEKNDELVSERFEIFFQNIELANGYHELTDPEEQRNRFELSLAKKKKNFPLDEKFLKALEKGFGDCFGVAIGFDRLLMLHLKKQSIHDVILFSWEEI